ncbi:MAG TPA: TonB-dependent receptor [Thermoanaerobaculia bacterium]|nr:TonB-dependent receptor [Thermoanaerobaculia bacterium]
MKRCPPLWFRAAWAALLVSLLAVGAYAQLQSGNIFGKVVANDGSALPGVTVTLTGVGAPQTFITDAQGDFRFLNLSPGSYSLKAELAGYGTATRTGVSVNIGRNSDVSMTLNPSVSQTITVTAEAPLLDTRRTGTGATVTEVELEQIPTARDPWVILQQVPGVLMDRINVGGNESGQQSQFVSKGVSGDQATYSVDGVNTTDMIATGASSGYYDFGSFEEIQVATGGTDPRVQTPGAQINMVTKRGTNDLSGSARYYLADGEWQAEAEPTAEARGEDPARNPSNVPYLIKANEIDQNREMGFEVGGPIIRDRLWLWGSYADQQIDLFTAQSDPAVLPPGASTARFSDLTTLETLNLKLNAQITRNNSATGFYADSSKEKIGRNAGPTRPPETTWNQGGFGPKGTYKIEDTHIFSSNFYLTGMYSKVNGGFGLWANSGAGCSDMDCARANASKSWVNDFFTGINRNTFLSVEGTRPQEQTRLDGSAFFSTGALSHELKFGFGYRSAGAKGLTFYPNDQFIIDFSGFSPANAPRCTTFADAEFGGPCKGLGLTYFYSIGNYNYEYKYNDIYVGDTMLWGNLTLQAGLRFDNQKGEAGDQSSPASANNLFRTPGGTVILPGFSVSADQIDTMEWDDISPRIGLTYALGAEKKTLLRAAYNRYIAQMGSNSTGFTGAIYGSYSYGGAYTVDFNGNDRIDQGEIYWGYTGGSIVNPVGFDPNHLGSALKVVRVDPDVESPSTDEFILGFEHELVRDFVVGVNYTHRDLDNFLWRRPEKTPGSGDWYTTADYIQLGTVTRPSTVFEVGDYSIPYYDVKPEVGLPIYYALTNRDGYSQSYDGVELSAVKRMASRWMLRGNFSWNDWTQSVESQAIIDPTQARTGTGCSVCDGADVVQGSGTISGAKGAVWINSEWAFNAAAVYQVPVVEANLGVNFTMRQGYPILYVHETPVLPVAAVRRQILVSDVTEHRLDNPYSVDLRLAKDFRFRGVGLELSVDAFNVTNNRVVLQRNADLARATARRPAASRIREYQSPRIFRVGARLTF